MRFILIAAATSLLSAAPVLAQAQAQALDAPTPSAAPAAAKEAPKMVCKSTLETGSLVKRHKVCANKSQWKYLNEQHENEARRVVQAGTGGMLTN